MTTITREQALKIIEAADEVISALAGTNEDVHPSSDNMLRLWDDLNDRYAPPEVVRELARIVLASLEAEAPNLPGGFTIEEAKELHENLVKSHISKALSGEKMKKENRDADLRWIRDVIVQAAWFVKASLEQTALSGNYPVTPDGWISCSEQMPVIGELNWRTSFPLLITCEIGVIPAYYGFVSINGERHYGFMESFKYGDEHGNPPQTNEYGFISNVTHWMQLPEPPQEVNRG
ncbi:DUF551 domain-containing protein [Escherichia coli]